jgi:hypothetical protein
VAGCGARAAERTERCPNTGLRVQGWSPGELPTNGKDTYDAVTCIMCRRVHLVNPATGKVIEEGLRGGRA